jgi:exodeoxyribonuclease VII large subunit
MATELQASPSAVMPVSLLVSSARLLIERHLGLVWVSGEISNFTRAASGHCYFNLKDAQAQVRCVMFRQKAQHVAFALRDGLAVEVRATPSIYEARGEFQLNADTMRLAGVGALYEQFARLKARLEAAGWFAAERKRALPAMPRAVGIVTSKHAAALRDILTTLARRWPRMPVILYPTAVQGAGAAADIAAAIATANARAEVDVLIIARGGGAIEDLWSFNEEVVAKALLDSTLPTVSGVGHETDFTICDFVADVRAPTPTAAAAMVVPDRHAVAARVDEVAARLMRAARQAQDARAQRLDQATRRLVHPAQRLAAQRERTTELASRLRRAWQVELAAHAAATSALQARWWREVRAPRPARAQLAVLTAAWSRLARQRVERARDRVAALGQNLAHLNPQGVLDRGFALVRTADGRIVQGAAQLAPGDPVSIAFARDGADAVITRVSEV